MRRCGEKDAFVHENVRKRRFDCERKGDRRTTSSGADRAFNSLSNGINHVSNGQADAELIERQ